MTSSSPNDPTLNTSHWGLWIWGEHKPSVCNTAFLKELRRWPINLMTKIPFEGFRAGSKLGG
jgi:hypothetical protein